METPVEFAPLLWRLAKRVHNRAPKSTDRDAWRLRYDGNMGAQSSNPMAKLIGVLTILASVVPLGIGVHFYRSTARFVSVAVACEGRITQLEFHQSEHGTSYTPVFVYRDASGIERTGRGSLSNSRASYTSGDSIPLLYDPANPDDVRVNRTWSLWFAPLICAIITVSLFADGLLTMFILPKWGKRRKS
jgi:uncharacterized protein DUF3592